MMTMQEYQDDPSFVNAFGEGYPNLSINFFYFFEKFARGKKCHFGIFWGWKIRSFNWISWNLFAKKVTETLKYDLVYKANLRKFLSTFCKWNTYLLRLESFQQKVFKNVDIKCLKPIPMYFLACKLKDGLSFKLAHPNPLVELYHYYTG